MIIKRKEQEGRVYIMINIVKTVKDGFGIHKPNIFLPSFLLQLLD